MKLMKLLVVSVVSLGAMGATAVPASASTKTAPKSIRGNFYAYQGHHKWARLSILAHKASLKYPGQEASKLTLKSNSKINRFSFKKEGNVFVLNSKNPVAAYSAFPEDGMKLISQKIGKKRYKVIRGYQRGTQTDFIKGKKIAHFYGIK